MQAKVKERLINNASATDTPTGYSLGLLGVYAKCHGISLYPDTEAVSNEVKEAAEKLSKYKALPDDLRYSDDDRLRLAGAYYQFLIKPLMASGSDAKKIEPFEVYDFCQRLSQNQPIVLSVYYMFLKNTHEYSTSPLNGVIDFAELEMLKYYALLTTVAQKLGFPLSVVLIDEAPICPTELFGITAQHQTTTKEIITAYLEKSRASKYLSVKTVTEVVHGALAHTFEPLYLQEQARIRQNVILELHSGASTSLTSQIVPFFDLIPSKLLEQRFGLSSKDRKEIREAGYSFANLSTHSQSLSAALFEAIVHFQTVMSLRREVADSKIRQWNFMEASSGNNNVKNIRCGVTRSMERWSFLPHPVRYRGQTRNPAYGLALYDARGGFRGIVDYPQLCAMPSIQLVEYRGRPIAAIESIGRRG